MKKVIVALLMMSIALTTILCLELLSFERSTNATLRLQEQSIEETQQAILYEHGLLSSFLELLKQKGRK